MRRASVAEGTNETVMGGEPVKGPAAGPPKLFAIKGSFSGDFSGARGAFLVVMDVSLIRLHHLFVVLAGERGDIKVKISDPWKTVESALINAKLSGGIAHQMSADVQEYMRGSLKGDLCAHVCNALQDGNTGEIKRTFEDIISKAIAETTPRVSVAVEAIAAAEAPEPEAEPAAPAAAEAAPEPQAATVSSVSKVKVDPVLSPVQGVPAKDLRPGTLIAVKIREIKMLSRSITKLIPAPGDFADGQFMGTVIGVEPGEFERMVVRVELAPDVLGIASCSGELRVKVIKGEGGGAMRAIAGTGGVNITTGIFVVTAVVIFAVLIAMALWVFQSGLI